MREWRLLGGTGVGGAEGLAFDEAMMCRYGRGERPPSPAALRLYDYRADCALVGRYQSTADEVDLAYCASEGVEIARRPTGGGAIIMGEGQLGVAIASRAQPGEGPRDTLRRFSVGVIGGLRALGVESGFRSKNDLEAGGRKIAGLGLYRDERGAVLFHASVLVDLDVERMLRVLRIPGAKLSDKAVARVGDRVTTVSREAGRGLRAMDVRDRFARGLARTLGVRLHDSELDARERARYRALLRDRYGTDAWTFRRSPRRDALGSSLLKTPEGLVRVHVAAHGDTIKSVLISGDFNVLPPGVRALESALKWSRAERERISAAVRETRAGEALGVGAARVAAALWAATTAALESASPARPLRRDGSCYFPEPAPSAEAAGALRTELPVDATTAAATTRESPR